MSNELNTVHVPLSYMEEFYNLRLHIDLVNAELEKQTRLRDSTKSSDATTPDCE